MKVCAWADKCPHFLSPTTTTATLQVVTPSIAAVIQELLNAKRTANRRPKYVKSLELYLQQFARGRDCHPINGFGVTELEKWFASRKEAASTRSSNSGRLSALFSFAKRRGYVTENPVERMERITIERSVPAILTPGQAREALNFIRAEMPRFLPWFALALFAGVRPEELDKLNWEAVNLDEKIITVDAKVSKVRRRRVTPLPPAAVEWLKFGGDLPLPLSSRRRYIRRVRNRLGFKDWPQDILRHTAASFLLASHPDAAKVALWLGNSPRILLRDYQQIVTAPAAEEFWKILPFNHQPQLL